MVLSRQLLRAPLSLGVAGITDRIVCGDFIELLPQLPPAFVDLLILDPPYNLTKRFGTESFRERSLAEYEEWFEGWFVRVLPLLKPATSLPCAAIDGAMRRQHRPAGARHSPGLR